MLASQKIAIAAHMHVLLRRKTGRVTDTEWMAENHEYALEIVRFARAKAQEDGHADLAEWADKLERAAFTPTPGASKPLVQQAAQLLQRAKAPPVAVVAAPPAPVASPAPVAAVDAPASDFGGSGFANTGFTESSFNGERPRKPKEPDVPRYVGGIR